MNMSVKNDIIALNEVVKQTTDLLREQSTSWRSIVDEIKKINQSAPSSYIKMQKDLADSIAKAEQVEQRYQATLSKRKTLQDKVKASMGDEERQLKANYQQQERVLNQQARWNAQMQKAENTYQRVQARVNQLTQTYNDLATRQALGQKLDTQQLATLAKLEGQLLAYDKILKQVDATVGKNQRNVGNYRSGFDGLGNSINQITRELPAFTFSAQTGFLALSNNIPILADEIKRVSDNVTDMRKRGEQVPGVMAQILRSFLSWQTVLSLAVTLITVYGKEIGAMFSEAFKGRNTMTALAESQKQYNEAVQEGSKQAQQEIQELKVLIATAQNVKLSTDQRTGAVDKLQKLYPNYFDNLTKEQVMNSDLTKVTKELTSALLSRAIAVASINKMTENASKILDLEEERRLEDEKLKSLEKQAKTQAEITKQVLTTTTRDEAYTTGRLQTATTKVLSTKRQIAETDKEIARLNELNARLSEKAMQNEANATKLGGTNTSSKKSGSGSSNSVAETTNEQLELDYKLANQLIENQVKVTKSLTEQMTLRQQQVLLWYAFEVAKAKGNQKEIEVLNAELTGKLIDLNNEEVKAIDSKNDKRAKAEQKTAELVKKAWKGVTDYIQEQLDKQVQAEQEATNKRREGFEDYAKGGFSFGSLGFGSLDIFQDQKFMEDFWKTMGDDSVSGMEKAAAATRMFGEIAKDVFDNISERQNAYYERQFANLEKEKEVALQFAGESTAGREAIEKQYEEKKVALQREQAKKQKQMAIFSAIINIAQGITASLAQGGPAGIILAALVGVLGAVQIASIASTPLPAFERGTQNAPEGWAITQEKGAEMITDKNGNIKTLGNNKGNQLTYLNKGDKVYTADETTQRINEMLLGTGVAPIVNTNVNSGLTKEDMFEVMQQTLSKQPQNSIIFDEHGIRAYQNRENSRTKLKNRNVKL